jgi:CDGSH-type Zn-finger protein
MWARIFKRTASGPVKLDPGLEPRWICRCGLSKNQTFCDGIHKNVAQSEKPGKLYGYDDEGACHEIADNFPAMRSG